MVGAVSPRQYSAGVLSQELCDGIPLLLLECISCRLRRSSSAIPATQYNPVSPVPDGCSVTNAHLCIIQPASRQPASQPASQRITSCPQVVAHARDTARATHAQSNNWIRPSRLPHEMPQTCWPLCLPHLNLSSCSKGTTASGTTAAAAALAAPTAAAPASGSRCGDKLPRATRL